jgi:hypothetical protein
VEHVPNHPIPVRGLLPTELVTQTFQKSESAPAPREKIKGVRPRRPSRWRWPVTILLILGSILLAIRAALPSVLQWYVNRTLDQSPLYDGHIGDIDLHLVRGGYSIEEVRIVKTTGNVPVPLFASPRVDLAIQWDALLSGEVVGRIHMHQPELNFVDGEDQGEDQTGAGGPWLEIIDQLFPFRINSATVRDGSIHFRAFDSDPPVDVYIINLQASIENLTNIDDETTPLIATVKASGLAMDHAKFQYEMKLDPFSYRPTFQLAVRLIGLDVTKVNALARAYGAFDFEQGWFDLVVELDAKEGLVQGYMKPLFRNLQVLSLKKDIPEDDVMRVFWEALVGVTSEILENQPRDQFGTMIPLRGDLSSPETDILALVGNVLRNAFVRAYLPRLQGVAEELNTIEFGPGEITDPVSVGND